MRACSSALQRRKRIDAQGPSRRNVARQQRDAEQESGDGGERQRGRSLRRRRGTRRPGALRDGTRKAECDADRRERHALAHDRIDDLARPRAERHPDADLTRALCDRIADQTVHADGSQQERRHRESAEQHRPKARLRDRVVDDLAQRARALDGELRIDRADLCADRRCHRAGAPRGCAPRGP